MIRALLAFILTAIPALADDWQTLDEKGISEALTGRTLQYETATQDFRASGKTLYTAGQDSWGNWSIRADQYCSQWPPSNTWNCYDVFINPEGSMVRFIGTPDDVTDGIYID